MPKHVTEDWSHFNRAVLRRIGDASMAAGAVPPTPAMAANAAIASVPGAISARRSTAPVPPSADRITAPLPPNVPNHVSALPNAWRTFIGIVLGIIVAIALLLMLLTILRHSATPPGLPLAPSPPASAAARGAELPADGADSAAPVTDAPTPSGSRAEPEAQAERVVTNYTTFHSVYYQEGTVVTGWVYGSNREQVPRSEYCYYVNTDAATRVDNKFDLQNRGSPRNPYPMSSQLDLSPAQWQEAGGKCRWSSPAAAQR